MSSLRSRSFPQGARSRCTPTGKGRALSSSPDFPLISLLEDYRQLSTHASLPFPREESAAVPVPAAQITTVEVMNELGPLIQTGASEVQGVARLLFPGDVPSLIVPRSCAATFLMDGALLRISGYIQEPRNSAFVESKLSAALKGSELLVRQSLEEAVNSPKKAAASVLAPSDFSFRFWTQLCGVILQDLSGKGQAERGGPTQSASPHSPSLRGLPPQGGDPAGAGKEPRTERRWSAASTAHPFFSVSRISTSWRMTRGSPMPSSMARTSSGRLPE